MRKITLLALSFIVCASMASADVISIGLNRALANSLYCRQLGGANCVVGTGTSRYPLDAYGTGSQIHVSDSDVDSGGYITGKTAFGLFLSAGASYNGTNFIAKNAAATTVQLVGGSAFVVTGDTGLTIGNTFTPTTVFSASSTAFNIPTGSLYSINSDVLFSRRAAATWQHGGADSATPTAQTIAFQGSRAATDTNVAGPLATFQPALGTGNAAGAQITVDRSLMGASGTAQQVAAHAFSVCESKTLSNTSATATTIATVGLASNSAGGLHALITVTATDGTNFDSETQDVTVSYVNKAGVITIGTPLISTSTAANNSGSATIGATVTGASPTISLKVTPVFGTIVPSTVTVYAEVFTHGAGAVACQ